MPTVHLRGIDVYYELGGTGPDTLFLNGSGATLERMGVLVDLFRARLRVAAYDQRGLGRTDVPADPPTMADYAADAIALLDHLGWERCRVVGISFGGMVAQEVAVTVPERIERLALLCTSPGGPDTSSYPLHELAELPDGERSALAGRLLDTRFDAEWLADHPADAGLAAMMAERSRAPRDDLQRRGEELQLAARAHHDVRDRLGRISCPTLVACGRYDGIAPLANGEAIAAAIPNADLRIYDGGHAFFAQDPSALPGVTEFLSVP